MAKGPEASLFKIIVVGGGIAGLAAAIALRAPGRKILVLEKSRMNREVGALISLQPNAQKIVEGWNIEEIIIKAQPTAERCFRILDTNGKTHMNINMDKRYGADRMVYHRQDLHAALREAALSDQLPGPTAEILTASAVVSCDCDKGMVTLQDSTTHHADLLIGADGIHSVLRDAVLTGIGDHRTQPLPTGISAYRLLVDTDRISELDVSPDVFDVRQQATTLMMGHDRRVIMGPARDGKMLGLVAMVPDEHMNEDSTSNSWTTPGSLPKLLDTFRDFPEWVRSIFKQAPDISLWQLRDIEPLSTWIRGRTIIIGDAAHAMLPTQGQGASQSIEDAEALQAFFADIVERPSTDQIEERLSKVFGSRYQRASLIQAYSRQQAKPATDKGHSTIKLNPAEFLDYNCRYDGAIKWLAQVEGASQRTLC